VAAVLGLNPLELAGRIVDRFVPAHFLPGVGDLFADHRIVDTIFVGGVTPGEASLHAGVAMIRLAILIRKHPHHFGALNFSFERTAPPAVGPGGHPVGLGPPFFETRLLDPRRWGACRNARAAGDAFRVKEWFPARRYLRFKTATLDR